jgi:hypothetical protein
MRMRGHGLDAMITPAARLSAVPPNPPQRGDFGTLWDGSNSGAPSRGVDVKTVWDSLVLGLSTLNEADQYEIRKLMLKYAGAAPPQSSITAAGGASLDRAYATDANRQIAMQADAISQMQQANDALWGRIHAENDAARRRRPWPPRSFGGQGCQGAPGNED